MCVIEEIITILLGGFGTWEMVGTSGLNKGVERQQAFFPDKSQ